MITLHMGCYNKEIIFYGEKNIENSPVTYCGPGELEKIFILLGINLHRYSNKIIHPCLWSPLIKASSKKNQLQSREITALGLNPQGEEIFFNKIFTMENSEISPDSEVTSNIKFFKNIKMLALLLCRKGLFKPGVNVQGVYVQGVYVQGSNIQGSNNKNINSKESDNSDNVNPDNNNPDNSDNIDAFSPDPQPVKWYPLLTPAEQDFFWRIIESAPFRLFSFTPSKDKKPSRFAHFYEAAGILTKFINQIINSSSAHISLSDEISKNILSNRKYAGFDHIIYNLKKGPEQSYSDLTEQDNLQIFLNSSNRFNRAAKILKKQIFSLPGLPLKFSLRLDIDREKNEWTILFTAKERRSGGRILNFDTLWEKIHSSKSINFLGREFENTQLLKFIIDSLDYLLNLTDEILKTCNESPGAQEFFKDLCYSLKNNKPEKIILKPESAYFFLKTASLIFQNRGIGLFMPSWWLKKAKAGISVSMKPLSGLYAPGGSVNNYSGLFDVDWKITVNGREVSAEELEEMAKQKLPFIKFRDTWIEVNTKQLKETLKFLKKASHKMTLTDAMKLSLEKSGDSKNKDSVYIDTDGWLKRILSRLSHDKSTLHSDPPENFLGTLRPYQIKGLAWLEYLNKIGLGACLADDMGLGKTVQALALIQKNINLKKCPNRACLVISPTSIVDNWAHEVKKFTPGLKVFVHHGQDRPGIKEFDRIFKKKDIIITSYGLVQRDLEILQKYVWSILIIDEAQKIKNPQTKQSRSVKKLRASFKIAMTGTPVENNLWDLWSIMDFLNPGYLGHRREFKNAFAQAAGNSESGEHLKVRLKKLTSPLILRRNKGDKSIINDLPEKIENKIFCTLTMEQAALYRAVLKKSREHLEGSRDIQRKGVILSTLTKLKQICNHPAHYLKDNSSLQGRSGKFEHLMDMLDVAIQNGDRALIFTQYKEMGDLLQGYISSLFNQEIFYLHGGVPKNQRNTMVTAFQNNKKAPQVFILSLRAGGVGLNLTRANHVFHFDRWWNPAVENQATDRAYRIGQKRTVQVHKLICAGTLEENIDKLLFNKERIADDIVGTGENWLTKLSNNDLKELLALRIDTFKT